MLTPNLAVLGGSSGPKKQVRRLILFMLQEGEAPPKDQGLARVVSPWTFTGRGQSNHRQGTFDVSVIPHVPSWSVS